jgi:glycolate oxidase
MAPDFSLLPSRIPIQNPANPAFTTDYSPLHGETPAAVLFPQSHQDCIDIMRWANLTNTPISVRGAGTGTTGGALCAPHAVLVSMQNMTRIVEIDPQNSTITAEPGVILTNIHTMANQYGLFYPPDPASLNRCTIGGNVAENAGGPRALKYGVTRDYVIGLQGVWANGEPFHYGGKVKKNVAGYDLIGLLVGSEGTLAIITQITLKLIPKPRHQREALATFDSPEHALSALTTVLQHGIQPSTAEFMVDTCIHAALHYLNTPPQFKVQRAAIIWQVDGPSEDAVTAQLSLINHLSKALDFIPMTTPDMINHVWGIRRAISLGLNQLAGQKHSEDIAVPLAKVPIVIEALEALSHPGGIQVLGYGHLGDGNIHVNILKMSASTNDWHTHAPTIIKQVMELAISNGGTITGEHGVGRTKKSFMPLQFSPHDLHLMQSIKRQVDPNGILNTDCMFPK